MECKTCGRKYHCCSSCYADNHMYEGFCSEKCWNDSAEYKRNRSIFRAFIMALKPDQKQAFKLISGFAGFYEAETNRWFEELKTEGKL